MRLLTDRREADVSAEHLANYAGRDDVAVLGLPRGGVVVRSKWQKRWTFHWTSSWRGSWAPRGKRNWRLGR